MGGLGRGWLGTWMGGVGERRAGPPRTDASADVPTGIPAGIPSPPDFAAASRMEHLGDRDGLPGGGLQGMGVCLDDEVLPGDDGGCGVG